MSYSTTAYLFFGVRLTEEQNNLLQQNYGQLMRDGLEIISAGDCCTCEPMDWCLGVVVAKDEWLEEIGPKVPTITREQRKTLTEWRRFCKNKDKPRWYLAKHGG